MQSSDMDLKYFFTIFQAYGIYKSINFISKGKE